MVLDTAIVPTLSVLAALLGRGVVKVGIPDFPGFILAGQLVRLALPHVAVDSGMVAGAVVLKDAVTPGLIALPIRTNDFVLQCSHRAP